MQAEEEEFVREQMNRYLRGQMDEKEVAVFKKSLEGNTTWQEMLLEQQDELDAIELLVERDLISKIPQWQAQEKATKGTQWIPLTVLLLVSVLGVGVYRYWVSTTTPDTQNLIPEQKDKSDKQMTTIDTTPVAVNDDKEQTPAQADTVNYQYLALAAYRMPLDFEAGSKGTATGRATLDSMLISLRSGQWQSVLKQGSSLPMDSLSIPDRYQALFLLGHAAFRQGAYTRAARYFQGVQSLKGNEISANQSDDAHWYAVLSEIASPGTTKAKAIKLLAPIAEPGLGIYHVWQKEAGELLRKIRNQ